jgi:hypothetical protein
MKKIVASVLYVTYLAFGVSAHAAEQDAAPSSDAVVSQKEVKKAERKTERKTNALPIGRCRGKSFGRCRKRKG